MSALNALLVSVVFMISSATPSFTQENDHMNVLNVAENLREEMRLRNILKALGVALVANLASKTKSRRIHSVIPKRPLDLVLRKRTMLEWRRSVTRKLRHYSSLLSSPAALTTLQGNQESNVMVVNVGKVDVYLLMEKTNASFAIFTNRNVILVILPA